MRFNARFLAGSVLFVGLAVSQGLCSGLSCDTLKSKIDDGLKAKGVQNYTLTVVKSDENAEGKVVGTCEGGTQKIVYSKGASAQPAAEKTKEAPADKKPAAKKE